MVWNLGTLIDYILNQKPFFKTIEDVKKFSGYYRNKNMNNNQSGGGNSIINNNKQKEK